MTRAITKTQQHHHLTLESLKILTNKRCYGFIKVRRLKPQNKKTNKQIK